MVKTLTALQSSLLISLGAVPAFTKTSSPELDALFTNVRENLFMPAHLRKEQQRLIYKSKYKRVLEVEPVLATIAGEDFTLKHIDVVKDVPNGREALKKAIKLMKEKNDWDNLPSLLQGLKNSGVKLPEWQPMQLVRQMGKAGRQDIILECLRRVSSTGFALKDPELVSQVMWWMQMKAIESDWDRQQTVKALSWAEMVVVMLEDPKHSGNTQLAGEMDPRTRPEVIGILLQLAAMRAEKHSGGKDKGGKVAEYAEKLLGAPMSVAIPEPENESVSARNYWLSRYVPVIHGMKVAERVLGPSSNIATALKDKSTELESRLLTHKDAISSFKNGRDQPLVGLWLHETLLVSDKS